MPLNVKAFGLAFGIIWGIVLAVVTLLAVTTGYASQFLGVVADVYIGYSVTAWGILLGLVYGFIDGLIGGAIFAWLYNKLEAKKK